MSGAPLDGSTSEWKYKKRYTNAKLHCIGHVRQCYVSQVPIEDKGPGIVWTLELVFLR